MTKFDSSDGPVSNNMDELQYYENVQTTSVPTKSGTEVPIRPHSQSDSCVPTSRPSSRPSSRGEELDHEAIEFIHKNSATPSTEQFDLSTRTIMKPLTRPEPESGFTFEKLKASQNNALRKPQSTSSSQSSHAVPPSSFEQSSPEHQVSARSVQEGISLASTSQGLGRIFSWLGSWLTLNLEAPAEYQKAVQPIGSPQSQDIPVADNMHTSSIPFARQSAPQRVEHSHMQSQQRPRRKEQVFPKEVDYLCLLTLIIVLFLAVSQELDLMTKPRHQQSRFVSILCLLLAVARRQKCFPPTPVLSRMRKLFLRLLPKSKTSSWSLIAVQPNLSWTHYQNPLSARSSNV